MYVSNYCVLIFHLTIFPLSTEFLVKIIFIIFEALFQYFQTSNIAVKKLKIILIMKYCTCLFALSSLWKIFLFVHSVVKISQVFLGIGSFLFICLSIQSVPFSLTLILQIRKIFLYYNDFSSFHFHCSFILKTPIFYLGIPGLILSFSYPLF